MERYKQAARTGLLSEVLQEGAAVFGALLIKCPLPVSFAHRCRAVARWLVLYISWRLPVLHLFLLSTCSTFVETEPTARRGGLVRRCQSCCETAEDES